MRSERASALFRMLSTVSLGLFVFLLRMDGEFYFIVFQLSVFKETFIIKKYTKCLGVNYK